MNLMTGKANRELTEALLERAPFFLSELANTESRPDDLDSHSLARYDRYNLLDDEETRELLVPLIAEIEPDYANRTMRCWINSMVAGDKIKLHSHHLIYGVRGTAMCLYLHTDDNLTTTDFIDFDTSEIIKVSPEVGKYVVFDNDIVHRVNTVKAGTRLTLCLELLEQ